MVTGPVNPLRRFTLRVAVPLPPRATDKVGGVSDREKSGVGGAATVRFKVVACDSPEDEPVIVTATGPPIAAAAEAVKVRVVLFPLVGVGLNTAVTPAGKPLALNATLPANPPTGVTVIVLVAVPPCRTETLAGLAESEKSGWLITVTMSVRVVLCVRVPLTPVTVIVNAPLVAVADAVNVKVLVPVVEAGLNTAVTPVGKPLALSATLPVNPPVG